MEMTGKPHYNVLKPEEVVRLFDEGWRIADLISMVNGSKFFTKRQYARDYVCNCIRKSYLKK